jgi:hypothetical protein
MTCFHISLLVASLLSNSLVNKKPARKTHTHCFFFIIIAKQKEASEQPMKTELALLPVLTRMAGETGCKFNESSGGPSRRK